MRFRDFSPEAVECLWDRWKYSIERVLYEFNEDVYSGRGSVRENSYRERPYLSLQTNRQCIYIFPIPGNRLTIGIFRCRINREYLSIANNQKLDRENLIGWFAMEMDSVEEGYKTPDDKILIIEQALKLLYKKHWSTLSF